MWQERAGAEEMQLSGRPKGNLQETVLYLRDHPTLRVPEPKNMAACFFQVTSRLLSTKLVGLS